MKTESFTVVRTTRTSIEADIFIAMLRGAGFHPVDLDTSSHFSLAGADVSYHIEVPCTEAKEAKALLDSYEASQKAAEPDASPEPPPRPASSEAHG